MFDMTPNDLNLRLAQALGLDPIGQNITRVELVLSVDEPPKVHVTYLVTNEDAERLEHMLLYVHEDE